MLKYSIDGSIVPEEQSSSAMLKEQRSFKVPKTNFGECLYNAEGSFSCVNKEMFYAPGDPTTAPTTTAPATTTTTAPATTTTTAPATTAPATTKTTAPATSRLGSGSYSKTCDDDILSSDKLTLTSTCRKPDGSILTTSKMCPNKSWENIDGNLMCSPDGNAWVPLVIIGVLIIIFLSIAHFGNIPAPKA
jgi:hypothetical protein